MSSQSNSSDDQPNPFYFRLHVPWYRIPQIVLMSITIVPLRILAFAVLNLIGYFLATIFLVTVDEEKLQAAPIKGWHKQLREWIRYTGRIAVHVGGFWNITIKGRLEKFDGTSSLVCAPHSTFLDSNLIFLFDDCPYVIGKQEAINYPFFGKLLKTTQPILVKREDTNTKRNIVEEMKKRAHSANGWPPSMLFTEATCYNRKALLPFKPGAFIPGKPIQPVIIRYLDEWDTVTWTWLGGANGVMLAWLSLCKLRNSMEIEYLPVYFPSEQEIADAALYAENVRQLMARALGVPCTHLTMEDAKRMRADEDAGILQINN